MIQPKVSVVIPIYNVEKYLDRCIDSVVNQTYKNLEIILVDDGSPDKCPEMCDEWAKKDRRIKVIHKENQGQGMARNTGIDNATGEYIFFFDSDDFVDLKTVEGCLAATEKADCDAVVFGRYDYNENGEKKEKSILIDDTVFEGEAIREKLLSGLFTYEMGFGVSVCSKMFRLSTIKDNNISFKSEGAIVSEDSFFVIDFFACAKTVSVIQKSYYYYCVRNNSFSREFKNDKQAKNNNFLSEGVNYIREKRLPKAVETHFKARYHAFTLSAIKQIYMSDLPEKEKKAELKAIFRDPVLHGTLETAVLKTEKRFVKLFFSLLKLKCYPLCRLLLKIRLLNQK